MIFKKLHLGSVSFGKSSLLDVKAFLDAAYGQSLASDVGMDFTGNVINLPLPSHSMLKVFVGIKQRRSLSQHIQGVVCAIALCHNVTPVVGDTNITYQASRYDASIQASLN